MPFRNNAPGSLFQSFEKRPQWAWGVSALWCVVVCGLAFLWNLGSTGLVDETEPLFAEAARQMIVRQDWITPYFNGVPRFDKPPLVYWLMAIAYSMVGVNSWAVRLPSALAAIALVGFSFVTLKAFATPVLPAVPNPRPSAGSHWLAAWIGAAALALNIQMLAWGRTGVSDMLLNGCIGSALLSFFWGYTRPLGDRRKPWWYLAFYIFCGLAVLAKGPIGIVLPVLVVVAFLLFLGNLRTVLREMQVVRGTLVFLLIAIPWYVLVIQANGQRYIDEFFGYHNVTRFTDAVNNHEAPWFFYLPVILLGFFPWAVHLPVAIARLQVWRRRMWQQQPRKAQLGLFALVWFAVIFGFFTVAATKLPSYVLPLMPAAAILVALLWSDRAFPGDDRPRQDRALLITDITLMVLLLAMAIALVYSPNWIEGDPAMPNFPQVIRESGILGWGAGIWAIAALAQLVLLLSHYSRWGWLVNSLAFLSFLVASLNPTLHLIDQERQLPLRNLSATITQVRQPREPVIMVTLPKPSVVFYTRRAVLYIPEPEDVPAVLKRWKQRSNAPSSVLILGTHRKIIRGLRLSPEQHDTLQVDGAYRLIRVKLPLQ